MTRDGACQSIQASGFTAFVGDDTAPLHELVREMWRLARALPLVLLREFEKKTHGLPRTTEVERLVVQRERALPRKWGESGEV